MGKKLNRLQIFMFLLIFEIMGGMLGGCVGLERPLFTETPVPTEQPGWPAVVTEKPTRILSRPNVLVTTEIPRATPEDEKLPLVPTGSASIATLQIVRSTPFSPIPYFTPLGTWQASMPVGPIGDEESAIQAAKHQYPILAGIEKTPDQRIGNSMDIHVFPDP